MDLYIYYRASMAHAQAVELAVKTLQSDLRRSIGASESVFCCGLKRRPQDTAAHHTWMEIYLGIPDNFFALLDAALAESALPDLIQGPRHAEFFMESLPCA